MMCDQDGYDQDHALWDAPLSCPGRYTGRVAAVTGGANGIGKAAVVRVLREGGAVVFGDIDRKQGERLLQESREKGFANTLRFVRCDVNEEQDVLALVQAASREFGRLDLMVNNAGTSGSVGPLLDTASRGWNTTIHMLLNSVFWGIRFAGKEMIRRGISGTVINIASIAALEGGRGGAAYSTAKAGVVNLTRCAAIELGRRNIRCNAICPGNIITPLLLRGRSSERLERAAVQSQAWPEPGRPEDVAGAVAFLGSEEARYITGCVLAVDGACMAGSPAIFEWEDGVREPATC